MPKRTLQLVLLTLFFILIGPLRWHGPRLHDVLLAS